MITREQVIEAQTAWGKGIVHIGSVYTNKQDYEAAAAEHIDQLYAYDLGPVLFKPTKAAQDQFRCTKQTALSYFVATNKACKEDGGFAITPWTAVRFDNHEILLQGNTALAMGNYFFTDTNGNEVKVEYSFGYVLDDQGKLKINLHHSSIPFGG